MKRYASHFLFLPGYGYLRQFAVEMEGERAVRIFPLSEEVENTEWLPGVILLLDEAIQNDVIPQNDMLPLYEAYFGSDAPIVLSSLPENLSPVSENAERQPVSFIPYQLFPFDFTTMRPVAGTRHRRLR